ncbi:DUF3102 domain-containing protein [Paenibacillus sp. EKM212P]|uniref:DUF3102 domain-containing protein n=1 Tax=Paenibacillus sp. EKM212P TaxID=1683680 RepID=UPI001EEA2CEF|nr:DUF3102 domain-containing protein [Paenibacillus sp. EKM212P]
MTQISLSSDLIEITAEINSFKQVAGQAVIEIGKRLKHVRDNDLVHGQWEAWLQSLDIVPRTAQRMIQAFEQFGKATTSSHLSTGKIFEMLSLPESIDREEFTKQAHEIPSTGEQKTVDEMTVRELREVKKALQQAQKQAETAKNSANHFEHLWQQAKNQPPKVITNSVEVVPETIKRELEDLKFQNNNLRAGYQEARHQLEKFELRDTTDFDEIEAQKQRKKLQHEADVNVLQIRSKINRFLEDAAITTLMEGALSAADPITKQKIRESIEMLESFTTQIKTALSGRIIGGVINE